jgi:sister-chromatid-cohesion protein PDS5
MNIVEPNKTQKKNAYLLAKELVIKCSDTLEPYIQAVSNISISNFYEEINISIYVTYDILYFTVLQSCLNTG